MESLRSSIAGLDSIEISSILAAHPVQVTLNIARSAIQVQGCNGDISAHFPLEDGLVAQLVSMAE